MKNKKLIFSVVATTFVVGFLAFNVHRLVFSAEEHDHSVTTEAEAEEHDHSDETQEDSHEHESSDSEEHSGEEHGSRGSGHGYGRGRYTTTDDYITFVLYLLPLVGILAYAGKNRFIK